MNQERIYNRVASVILAVALFFFVLTTSIGLPIYIRSFYYGHITALDLPAQSGYTYEEIREAYDEVLDYLTKPGLEFSAGVMAFSPEGAAHFEDCKVLFDLNAAVLLASGAVLLVMLFLRRRFGPYYLGRMPAAFWSGVAVIVIPIVVGALAATDFDRAFTVFHHIFFPGKDNWLFNPYTDAIIRVLPQDFFMNCAILIGSGVVLQALAIIVCCLIARSIAKRYR